MLTGHWTGCSTTGTPTATGSSNTARKTPAGLANQGWKDSWDGINFADGTIAEAPIALAEVQGYAYAAYRARAAFAREAGDAQGARHWQATAARLKCAFNQAFWLPDKGWFAAALDRDKRPVDALTSNIGHCLWTGIADVDKAAAVADHLLSQDMFSGWGIRTLATSMAAYNPMSYHNGSVWPHDNALCAAGLMRYGFTAHAQRVAEAIFDAAAQFGYRLPELFCGFPRGSTPGPHPLPDLLLAPGLGRRRSPSAAQHPAARHPTAQRPTALVRSRHPQPLPTAPGDRPADRNVAPDRRRPRRRLAADRSRRHRNPAHPSATPSGRRRARPHDARIRGPWSLARSRRPP